MVEKFNLKPGRKIPNQAFQSKGPSINQKRPQKIFTSFRLFCKVSLEKYTRQNLDKTSLSTQKTQNALFSRGKIGWKPGSN